MKQWLVEFGFIVDFFCYLKFLLYQYLTWILALFPAAAERGTSPPSGSRAGTPRRWSAWPGTGRGPRYSPPLLSSCYRLWISGREAQQCCDRWLGWTACDWPDLTLSWEITECWSGDQEWGVCGHSEERERDRLDRPVTGAPGIKAVQRPGDTRHPWQPGSPNTDPHPHTRGCNAGETWTPVNTVTRPFSAQQIDGHNHNALALLKYVLWKLLKFMIENVLVGKKCMHFVNHSCWPYSTLWRQRRPWQHNHCHQFPLQELCLW